MNSPQLEEGFTRIANGILEKLITINLSSYQTRVLLYIIRKTYGFNKKEDWISTSQIVKATGIHKAHVSRTKKELLMRKIVTSSGNKIAFQKNSRLWCELPNQVTVTKSGNKVTSTGTVLPVQAPKLPVQADTKDTIQKTMYTKEKMSKDITKRQFGNTDINEIISYFKETLGFPMLDGSIQQNRNYAFLCIKKFGGLDKVKTLIDSTKTNHFWATKITSFMKLYYNGVNIISSNRNQKGVVTVI